jgi:hypothetical protein
MREELEGERINATTDGSGDRDVQLSKLAEVSRTMVKLYKE